MLSRPYQNRWNNQTYVVNDRPTLDTGGGGATAAVTAPLYPGQGAGGGGGGGGGTLAARPMFQQSLSKERAMNAFRAGTFAANAAPAMPGQSAYGGDQNAAAGRKAFVASQMAQANAEDFGNGPNVFANAAEAQAESGRKTTAVNADAGLKSAQGGLLKAEGDDLTLRGRTLYPGQAKLLGSQAGSLDAQSEHTRFLTPYDAASSAAGTRMHNAAAGAAEAETPFIAPREQQKLQSGAAELDRYRQQTPGILGLVGAQTDEAKAHTKILGSQAAQLDKQTAQVGKPTPTDPVTAIAAEKDRYSLAKQMGQDAGESAYNNQWFRWFGKSKDDNVKEQTAKAYEQLRQAGAGAGASADPHPDGATGTHNGRPVVKKNGQWVYTDGK